MKMIEALHNKLIEILDFSVRANKKEFSDSDVEDFAMRHDIVIHDDYKYYLKHYGNDYVANDYYYIPEVAIDGMEKIETNGIFGLNDDSNNIEKACMSYKDVLPSNVFPIADISGGDVFCMDKHIGAVYLWLHDLEENNLYFAGESFSAFIMAFVKQPKVAQPITPIGMKLSGGLDAAIKAAAEKYKK